MTKAWIMMLQQLRRYRHKLTQHAYSPCEASLDDLGRLPSPSSRVSSVRTLSRPSHFFVNPLGSQQITRPSMCPEDPQRNAAGGKLAVQLVQHARACEVRYGEARKIADH